MFHDTSNEIKIRLNKFISRSSLCSRRHAEKLIRNGDISVNGVITTHLATVVTTNDIVYYKNKQIQINNKKTYIVFNKPLNCLTTSYDPQHRRTVMDYIKSPERLYPVGRLDRNTTGVLLLTNDGDMTTLLTHPSSEIQKIYNITIDKSLTSTDEQRLRTTISLPDGMFKFDKVAINNDRTSLTLTLHSGRNRIIRRVFEQLQYRIISLERINYAGITVNNLPLGRYRHLTPHEINTLKKHIIQIPHK
ncbi:MAG: rRNA pseudouridine synthase [Cytophagales bacterium]|nr:rRNA pseudouridine synthase [Cytophagales bacterium]